MTRFAFRCRKAAILILAILIGILLSLFHPAHAQSVQAMVRNQPFPHAEGVAMDSQVYGLVKAKLQAADALRISSQHTIDALSTEIAASKQAYADLKKLDQYDAHKADSLLQVSSTLQQQLDVAKSDLRKAQDATDSVVKELPRRIRKALKGASPDQIATAVTSYIHTLQQRKWTWSAASMLVGIGITVFKAFL